MIGNLIRRAVVTAIQASKKLQGVQVSLGKGTSASIDECEHFEPLGLTSRPSAGAEALVASIDGAADHPVVLGVVDRRIRPRDLEAGETCLYDAHDHQVRLEDDRIILKSADVRLGSNNAGNKVAREGDTVTITRADNLALFAILDAAATLASLPPVSEMAGTITSGSDVTRTD